MNYDKLYDICPIFIQNFIISSYGWKIYKQRYGEVYRSQFDKLSVKEYRSLEEEKQNQIVELKKLLRYAKENSRYYSKIYKNIDIDTIKSINCLKRIPVLEKEQLRLNVRDVCTIAPEDGVKSFTGGTTGKSLEVYFTNKDFQKRMAYLDAFKYKCGIHNLFTARKATFSGRPIARGVFQKNKNIYWRFNKKYNQVLYSTFDMQEAKLHYYLSSLNSFKPELINGFVSAIYQLAQYILNNNAVISFIPSAIFTTSEALLPFHREVIQKAFKCKVFNQYASAEGAPFITECIAGRLHYNMDTGIIETNGNGEMLVTSFTSYGTPLIRYNIGDKVTFGRYEDGYICECGSCHPIVDSIDGRAVDYLYSLERGKVSLSHLADVIKGVPNSVQAVQFVQSDLTNIEVNLVVDEYQYKKADEDKIIKSLKYRFGGNMNFIIIIVDEIERTAGGKFPLIKNNLKYIP